jgi:hypothetical protein
LVALKTSPSAATISLFATRSTYALSGWRVPYAEPPG